MGACTSHEKLPPPTVFEMEQDDSGQRKSCRRLLENLTQRQFRKSVYDVYAVDSETLLGEGKFGRVVVGTHRSTGQKCAIKSVNLRSVTSAAGFSELMKEVEIHGKLNHPNIAKLREVFVVEQERMFMVMDLCSGGDLLKRLEVNAAKKGSVAYQGYTEEYARLLVCKITRAIRYMHENNVAHRDLKLENIMYETPAEDSNIKLIDFGLSAHFSPNKKMKETVGTCYYTAPEVFKGSYTGPPSDMFSLGVITYILLSGRPPFLAATDEGVLLKIRFAKHSFGKLFDAVSPEAKDFINQLLVKDPKKRLTAKDALEHDWLSEKKKHDAPTQQLSPEVMKGLRHFCELSKLKKIALEVIAHSLEPQQLAQFTVEFEKLDKDGIGEISRENFVRMVGDGGAVVEAERMFDALDISGSGSIAFNSLVAGALAMKQLDEVHVMMAFDRLDHNHKGVVDTEDLSLIVGALMTEEEVQKALHDIKSVRNRTGGGKLGLTQITRQEFVDMMITNLSRVNLASMTNIASLLESQPIVKKRHSLDLDVSSTLMRYKPGTSNSTHLSLQEAEAQCFRTRICNSHPGSDAGSRCNSPGPPSRRGSGTSKFGILDLEEKDSIVQGPSLVDIVKHGSRLSMHHPASSSRERGSVGHKEEPGAFHPDLEYPGVYDAVQIRQSVYDGAHGTGSMDGSFHGIEF